MQRRSVRRNDPRYKQLRTRNNESVKKSREKTRHEQNEIIQSINQLEHDNQQLSENLQILKQEYQQLHTIFKQHTGIDIDQMSPSNQLQESSSTPVLTINTTKDNSSSNNELDVNNLDGSIVLINGVQYKIVSMTKN
jgi:predicted nuclease with TOPRIM domain